MNEIRIEAIELHLHRLDTAVEALRRRLLELEQKVLRSQTSEAQPRLPGTSTPQEQSALSDRLLQVSKIPPLYSGG